MKHGIQIIGGFLEPLEQPLFMNDIMMEDLIAGVNTLSICDDRDDKIASQYTAFEPSTAMLDVQKNFDRMISHDTAKYQSNQLTQPHCRAVRYKNEADYILVYNSLFNYPMTMKDDVLYSRVNPTNEFVNAVFAERHDILSIPYSRKFNWKYTYDRFIDMLMAEFPSDHIILLRSSAGPYAMEKDDIEINEWGRWNHYSAFVREVDEYFAERTNCICIDDFFASISHSTAKWAAPFERRSNAILEDLATTLRAIIDGCTDINSCRTAITNKNLRRRYYPHIDSDIRPEYEGMINDAATDIAKLDEIFAANGVRSLSELNLKAHISENDMLDIIKEYLKFFRCDINDIITVYRMYGESPDTAAYTEIVKLICTSKDSIPVRNAIKLREANESLLKSYRYIQPRLIDIINSNIWGDRVYLPLNNEYFLILDPDADDLFTMKRISIASSIDFNDCRNNGYAVPVVCAGGILSDYRFYIDRAKDGSAHRPISIAFDSSEQFIETLESVNWKTIFENEPYCLIADRCDVPTEGFVPVCDLSFLFEETSRVFLLRNGLADQMCHYLAAKYAEKYSKNSTKFYYDDVFMTVSRIFDGVSVNKVIHEDISDKLISKKLSPKLRIVSRHTSNYFADTLFKNGYTDMEVLCSSEDRTKRFKYASAKCCPPDDMKNALKSSAKFQYWSTMIRPETLDPDLAAHIDVTKLDERNQRLAEEMLACDAVVVHVRRGDYVTVGILADTEFYRESMDKLAAIPDYENKRFFVFSDDIPWCMNNTAELGFDKYFPDADITYVDHNKMSNDYMDLLMMTYGKVIIASNSGFARMAGWLSSRCEVFMCYNLTTMSWFEKIGKTNKYNVGPYKKKYFTDWSGNNKTSTVPNKPAAPQPAPTTQKTTPTAPIKNVVKAAISAIAPKELIPARENIEWLNFWFDNGNEKRKDRLLLIGDSVAREYRRHLGLLCRRPVDFFASSTTMADELFWKELQLFFSVEEYRQQKVHIQIGYHGIDSVCNANHSNDLSAFEQEYERLITTVKEYIPDITLATIVYIAQKDSPETIDETINNEVIKRNEIIKKLAAKYSLPLNDLYSYTYNDQVTFKHRDAVHFLPEANPLLAEKIAQAMKLK